MPNAQVEIVVRHLRRLAASTGAEESDRRLLQRFTLDRDEAAFESLVRRHGSSVLGVCRRVLGDAHDAEDAFQATFLVLARRAASVVKRESVGCYLYAVAYHTALEAGRARARRRVREKQVKNMPDPEAAPAEAPDRLSEKYRAAVVLCDLEGHSRRDAARELGVPEGTLSSRLAKARKLLAKRLAGRGLLLTTAALTAVGAGAASGQVPAALANSTTKAAALVAAGQLAAVSTPAVALMKGVMKTMLLNKLRLMVGVVMVAAACAAVGFVCRPGDEAQAQTSAAPDKGDGKHVSELDALRKENELLKFNLKVLLEKAAAQEKELEGLRGRQGAPAGDMGGPPGMPGMKGRFGPGPGEMRPPGGQGHKEGFGIPGGADLPGNNFPGPGLFPADNAPPGGSPPPLLGPPGGTTTIRGNGLPPGGITGGRSSGSADNVIGGKGPPRDATAGAAQEVESALKALQSAHDKEGQRRATDALEKAMKKLRKELDKEE